jgi:hypothetical protein
MNPNRNSKEKRPLTRLFPFTEQEERMMARAIARSKKHMESYGKGYTPTIIGVDRRNYIGAPQPIDTI